MLDLNISKATKNNWERLGKGTGNEDDNRSRLTKRANKQYSVKNIIPVEYFSHSENEIFLSSILDYLKDKNIDVRTVIYNIARNLLAKNGLIKFSSNDYQQTSNEYLNEILYNFNVQINDDYLLNIPLPLDEQDFIGIVYQSLLNEGNKNQKGSYYTPQSVVKSITADLSKNATFLDPCCGTGSFLLSAASKVCNPQNIWGCDIDEIACFIAKINLIIKFKDVEFKPNIYNVDFISKNILFKSKFDVIATNPPWGAQVKPESRKLFPNIKSGESFSYIIAKSATLLNDEGSCSFVLPEAILNIKTHKDIREFILNNFAVREISMYGKVFSGVLTDVVLLKLDKTNPHTILVSSNGSVIRIDQRLFEKTENYNFAIFNNKDAELLKKIYSISHSTLVNSRWGLGIVTGNNKQHIISKQPGAEMIYTGKEVNKYILKDTDKYIYYMPDKFQQCAPDDLYRAQEKLIYKFISKNLVFAYDNKGLLVLNSANILIPNVETHNIKTVLAFLNSKLFQYINKKKFNVLKVLKSNLVQFPFPILSSSDSKNIETLVNAYISNPNEKYLEEIDDMVYNIFKLNVAEVEYIAQEL